jgi:hypothetical protein
MLINPIVKGVVSGIKELNEQKQYERMQAEILDGWIFKVKVAVERELHKHNADHKVYVDVVKAINKVVKEEFQTDKI